MNLSLDVCLGFKGASMVPNLWLIVNRGRNNVRVVAAYLLTRVMARIYMDSNLRRRGEEILQMVLE